MCRPAFPCRRDLSVKENIRFSALTRLPRQWTRRQKLDRANEVITMLELDDVRTVVGSQVTLAPAVGCSFASHLRVPLCRFVTPRWAMRRGAACQEASASVSTLAWSWWPTLVSCLYARFIITTSTTTASWPDLAC